MKLLAWIKEQREVFYILGLLLIFYALPGNLTRQVWGIDDVLGGYPVHTLIRSSGEDVRWIPFLCCGVPAWLPPNPMSFFVDFYSPVELVQTRYYFLMLLLAGTGMFLWAKRRFPRNVALFGGIAWMLAPIMVSLIYAGHAGKIAVMGHFPWLLLAIDIFIERQTIVRWLFLSIVVFFTVFTWHTQLVVCALFFAAIYGLWHGWRSKKTILLALLAVGLGMAPAIPHYIKFKKIISATSRASGVGTSLKYTLPISEIPKMIDPRPENPKKYLGKRGLKLHTEYMGIFVFALGCLGIWAAGKRRWLYLGIGTIAILLSVGVIDHKMIRAMSMALFGLTFSWTVLAMYGLTRVHPKIILIIILFTIIDLSLADYRYIQKTPQMKVYPQIPIEYRAFDLTGGCNSATKGGTQLIEGMYPLIPKTYVEFMGGTGILPTFDNLYKHDNFRKLANAKYVFFRDGNNDYTAVLDAQPKAYMVGKYRVVPGNCVHLIPEIDVANEVILAEAPTLGNIRPGTFSTKIVEYKFNSLSVETEGNANALLVLCDNWYPGWRAHLDGIEIKIIRANHTFRAVEVPAGKHRITMIFDGP